jgi:4-alpha-glucanotransferase
MGLSGNAAERAAGILLAVSSLPAPSGARHGDSSAAGDAIGDAVGDGIGTFGAAAREWLRFLAAARQRYWQILPLGPAGWGDSPYQSFSAFAISSYYIDLDILIEQGLLTRDEVHAVCRGRNSLQVDYGALYRTREPLLRTACARFQDSPAFAEFRLNNQFWLEDYSLFMALKKKNKGRCWQYWDTPLKLYDDDALRNIRLRYADDIRYHSFVQYTAYTQWMAIKEYANSLGVAIIGDMPIYVAIDSADAWANSELFLLDAERRPLRVAGCPPDPFAADGQLWGNPLYRWDYIAQTGFKWWIDRLRISLALYDVVRIDHFRGFESFYAIAVAAVGGAVGSGGGDARNGEWVKGPGLAFIDAVHRDLPGAAIIAEDLGYLTPEVQALLEASGFPGMKILQFAFDSREASDYMPYTYGRNCVAYTGTHDNPTIAGWFKTASAEDVNLALEFLGIKNARDGGWACIRSVLASAAGTAIIPMQDYLGLDNRARMNTPATLGGTNWRWRMSAAAATPALAEKISRLTKIYGRCE